MNLEKAIELLQDLSDFSPVRNAPNMQSALKLGIEALKREASWRYRFPHQSHLPFPSETKD